MILNDIKEKLEEIDPKIYYGIVDNEVRETAWNYTVFNRVKLKRNQNRTGLTDYFQVHIVRENFIPDGVAEQYIAKMQEIPGVRVTDEDGVYDYVQKPNTNHCVEMLTLTFSRARK